MNWRGFISFAVLSAGLVGAVSYFGCPNANTERPDGAGMLVSNGPSREPLPRGHGRAAKAFRTFAPQGTWFNTVSAGAMEEPPGMRGALSANSTPWQTVITEEAGGDWPNRILLTLIKGHVAPACGQICPEGQSLAADGRCLPVATPAAALVVETPTLPTEVTANNMRSTAMMIGGPKPEPGQKSNVPSVIENLFKHPLGSP